MPLTNDGISDCAFNYLWVGLHVSESKTAARKCFLHQWVGHGKDVVPRSGVPRGWGIPEGGGKIPWGCGQNGLRRTSVKICVCMCRNIKGGFVYWEDDYS